MRSLLEHAARLRSLYEHNAHLEEPTRRALKAAVEFIFAACPGPIDVPQTKSPHTIFMHPNNRCCVTIEPNDLRTPYYEWRHVYGSWALCNRHCWLEDAERIAAGPVRDPEARKGPLSSRPATFPPAAPTVIIMPLEEQIRRLLLVEKDRGFYNGATVDAVMCLENAGFDLDARDVKEALWKVIRGASFTSLEHVDA